MLPWMVRRRWTALFCPRNRCCFTSSRGDISPACFERNTRSRLSSSGQTSPFDVFLWVVVCSYRGGSEVVLTVVDLERVSAGFRHSLQLLPWDSSPLDFSDGFILLFFGEGTTVLIMLVVLLLVSIMECRRMWCTVVKANARLVRKCLFAKDSSPEKGCACIPSHAIAKARKWSMWEARRKLGRRSGGLNRCCKSFLVRVLFVVRFVPIHRGIGVQPVMFQQRFK